MKKRHIAYLISSILFVIICAGCAGTVNESVRDVTEPVGGVAAVPQSITQGVASGYVDQTGKSMPNPYDR